MTMCQWWWAADSAHSGRKPVGDFPSDPHYASWTLTATPSKISCLGTMEYLSTAILDCIIQCTVLPPNSSEEAFPPMIGSLGCEGYISSCNYTASLKRDQVRTTAEWKAHQCQVSLLRRRLVVGIINPKPPIGLPQRLIIPFMNPPDMLGHFFVACFEFDVRNPKFLVAIAFYDSLERAKRRIHQSSTEASIVKEVNYFLMHLFCMRKSMHPYDSPILTLYCTTLYRASISNSIQYTLLLVSNTTLVHWPCTVLGYTGRLVIQ